MMKSMLRLVLLVMFCIGMLALPASAQAPHGGEPPGQGGPQPPGGGGQAEQGDGTHNLRHMANSPAPGARTSDLAFWGTTAVVGSFDGFRLVDITNPNKPRQIGDLFPCNGAQGDVSIYGDLVFRSVDTPQSSTDCDSTNVTASTEGHFEGVQVFDVSDPENPEHINSIYVDCGSHTHTLVPDEDNGRLFIYVSSYPLGGAALGPNCVRAEDGGGHSKISIIEVDLDDPSFDGDTTVFPYFLDDDTPFATYLGAFTFRGCHDISVFIELNLAAAACFLDGQLWDISDPAAPEFLWRYQNPAIQPANIDLFHSAAFTWDGEVVAFGDESGGGGAARCVDPTDDQGRIWFVDTETGTELASYKIPRSEPGVCTMHNFNFIPQRGGNYTLVSSAYTAGTTVVDVNALLDGASEAEAEIAWAKLTDPPSNSWSSYWYNGRVYASDNRGLDVFLLRDGSRAREVRLPHSNPQTQMNVIN